jgi:hypothetical protein
MRIKNETVFVASDLGRVIEAAQGSKLLRKVIDVLRPERSGISGESIELEGHEISKGLLAAELFRNGAGAALVRHVISKAPYFIIADENKSCVPGLIGLYRLPDGSAFLCRYFPRHALNELAERLAKPYLPAEKSVAGWLKHLVDSIPDPQIDLEELQETAKAPWSSIVLLDLNEILVRARERVEALRESLPSDFPVEKWLDAAVMASQVRDEVDSIVEESKSKNQKTSHEIKRGD